MASLFPHGITGRIRPEWLPVNYTQLCFLFLYQDEPGWDCRETTEVSSPEVMDNLRETRPQFTACGLLIKKHGWFEDLIMFLCVSNVYLKAWMRTQEDTREENGFSVGALFIYKYIYKCIVDICAFCISVSRAEKHFFSLYRLWYEATSSHLLLRAVVCLMKKGKLHVIPSACETFSDGLVLLTVWRSTGCHPLAENGNSFVFFGWTQFLKSNIPNSVI